MGARQARRPDLGNSRYANISRAIGTPWGNADTLRSQRLRPGPGTPRAEVDRNQRERLMAATVATVAEKGYGATTVADLVALSGVSRSAFYRHFDDKQDCFLATVEAIVAAALATVSKRYEGEESWEPQARGALQAFVRLIVAQPAAARLCLVDAYAAGPEAIDSLERAVASFEAVAQRALDELPRAPMPAELTRAIVGGLHKVLHTRLRRGDVEELADLAPELWDWGLSYEPPPQALGARRRHEPAPASRTAGPHGDSGERVLRAATETIAARGYGPTKVIDIASAASVSLTTFYEHFDGKEEALIAALDAGQARMFAATLPPFRRARSWPDAVRAALHAMFGFLAAEPDFARLGTVAIYATGARALERRDRTIERLLSFLEPGYELAPEAPPIAAEAIGGAIYGLLYETVREAGAAALPAAVPLATFVALAPFLGTEDACAVANGRSAAGGQRG